MGVSEYPYGSHIGDENTRSAGGGRPRGGPIGATKIMVRSKPISKSGSRPPARAKLLKLVVKTLDDNNGQDIVVIDLAKKSAMADYIVVCTGTSQRHLGSMAEHLRAQLKANGRNTVPVEGLTQGDWILVDGGDVIVHLFRPEVRAFYALEKMWSGDETESLVKPLIMAASAGVGPAASEAMA